MEIRLLRLLEGVGVKEDRVVRCHPSRLVLWRCPTPTTYRLQAAHRAASRFGMLLGYGAMTTTSLCVSALYAVCLCGGVELIVVLYDCGG